jgi:hypothetical protein
MTVEELDTGAKNGRSGLQQGGGDLGRSMTFAETYRRYAAECVCMCRWQESISEKALFIEMATKWLRLAELAEKEEPANDSPLAL